MQNKLSKPSFDRIMAIFGLHIFIVTLKMHSKTGRADWAEIFRIIKGVDCRIVQKISSWTDL